MAFKSVGSEALRAARIVTYRKNTGRAGAEFGEITGAEAAKIVGVSKDSVTAAKKLIKHNDQRILAAVENGGLSLQAAIAKISKPADASPSGTIARRPSSFRLKIPQHLTPEQHFRELLSKHKSFTEIGEVISNKSLVRYVRDLFRLVDQPGLSPNDAEIVRDALKAFNEEHKLSWSIEPIARKVIGDKRHRTMKPGRRHENFRRMLIIVSQAADNTIDCDIPFLTPEQTDEALERIASARSLLAVLHRRLKQEQVT